MQDVEGEPGALPLLSHALRTTWERREGRTLTVDGYRATGGIRGAVAQSAEALYEQVPADQRPLVRDLLLRLVALSPDGQPVRNRVPRRTVATDAAHDDLIELLVGARLVTSDDGVVQLAHEALARAWPRLQGWLDEDVEGQRILRHLAGAADTWDAMGRPDSELYRGARLAHALDWRERANARPDPHGAAPSSTPAEPSPTPSGAPPRIGPATRPARTGGSAPCSRRPPSSWSARSSPASSPSASANGREREGRVATARELAAAANANLDVDPERSILLALAAVERTRPDDGAAVLPAAEEALHRCRERLPHRAAGAGRGRPSRLEPGRHRLRDGGPARTPASSTSAMPGPASRCGPSRRTTATSTMSRSTTTARCSPPPAPTARRASGTRPPARSCTPSVFPGYDAGLGRLGALVQPRRLPLRRRMARRRGGQDRRPRNRAASSGRSARSRGPNDTSFDPTGARLAISSWRRPDGQGRGRRRRATRCSPWRGTVVPAILDVAWSPDGESIATASLDGSARVFDAGTGRPAPRRPRHGRQRVQPGLEPRLHPSRHRHERRDGPHLAGDRGRRPRADHAVRAGHAQGRHRGGVLPRRHARPDRRPRHHRGTGLGREHRRRRRGRQPPRRGRRHRRRRLHLRRPPPRRHQRRRLGHGLGCAVIHAACGRWALRPVRPRRPLRARPRLRRR